LWEKRSIYTWKKTAKKNPFYENPQTTGKEGGGGKTIRVRGLGAKGGKSEKKRSLNDRRDHLKHRGVTHEESSAKTDN